MGTPPQRKQILLFWRHRGHNSGRVAFIGAGFSYMYRSFHASSESKDPWLVNFCSCRSARINLQTCTTNPCTRLYLAIAVSLYCHGVFPRRRQALSCKVPEDQTSRPHGWWKPIRTCLWNLKIRAVRKLNVMNTHSAIPI